MLIGSSIGPYHIVARSAKVAWERSTARATRGSIATSQSRFCPTCSRPIPSGGRASSARRRRSPRSIIPTSRRSTASRTIPSAGSGQARSASSGQVQRPRPFDSVTAGGSLALVMELVEGPTLAELMARRARAATRHRRRSAAREPAERSGGASPSMMRSASANRLPTRSRLRTRPASSTAISSPRTSRCARRRGEGAGLRPRAHGRRRHARHQRNSDSPTVVSPAMTAQGMIVGTAAYMSPEQARGHIADARIDIWAFGVVLFEMLAGAPLFEGKTVSDVLASVLRDQPRWEELPSDTPPRVQRLLRRCLQKDPDLRLRHAGDARLELLDNDGSVTLPRRAGGRRVSRRALILAVALVGAGLTGAFVAGLRWTRPVELPVRKWMIPHAPVGQMFTRLPAISPDGRRVAYLSGSQLRIRDLSALESRLVPVQGSPLAPTWSPDSTAVAFVLDEQTLWRVQVAGGAPTKLCDLPVGVNVGLAWRADRTIVLNMSQGPGTGSLFAVPDGGGTPRALQVEGARDGDAVLYLRGLPDGSLNLSAAARQGLREHRRRRRQACSERCRSAASSSRPRPPVTSCIKAPAVRRASGRSDSTSRGGRSSANRSASQRSEPGPPCRTTGPSRTSTWSGAGQRSCGSTATARCGTPSASRRTTCRRRPSRPTARESRWSGPNRHGEYLGARRDAWDQDTADIWPRSLPRPTRVGG